MDIKAFLIKYSLFSCIIYFLMSCLIIKYINELENKNCECSNYWYRDFIKYFTCIFVVIVGFYIYNQKHFLKILINNTFLLFLMSIIKFLGIIYFGILILYFIKLKNSDCKCSKDWKRKTFLYPILFFSITMILILFLLMKKSIQFLLS